MHWFTSDLQNLENNAISFSDHAILFLAIMTLVLILVNNVLFYNSKVFVVSVHPKKYAIITMKHENNNLFDVPFVLVICYQPGGRGGVCGYCCVLLLEFVKVYLFVVDCILRSFDVWFVVGKVQLVS